MARSMVLWTTAIAVLLLAAQTFSPLAFATVDPNAYVSSKDQYSINPPSGWTVDSSGTLGTSVIFYGPTASNFRVNMNIIAGSTNQSLSDFVASTKVQLSQSFTNYQLLAEGAVTIGGVNGYYLVNSFTQGVYNIEDNQTIIIQNQKGYVITSTALTSNYATYQPAMDESVQTFRINSAGFPWTIAIVGGVIAAAIAVGLTVFVRRRRARAAMPPVPSTGFPGTVPSNPPPP